MPSRISTPTNLRELIKNPEKLRKAIRVLDSLERFEVLTSEGRRIPVQVSDLNAIVDLRETARRTGVVPYVPPSPFQDHSDIHPLAQLWYDGALANGGSVNAASLDIASDLCWRLDDGGVIDQIQFLAPFLGQNWTAAKRPLIDRRSEGGISEKGTFTGAEWSESTGVVFDGSSQALYVNQYQPKQLSAADPGSGGIGVHLLAAPTIACYCGCETPFHGIFCYFYFAPSGTGDLVRLYFGGSSTYANLASPPTTGFYYGQRNGASLRSLYLNGAGVASSVGNDPTDMTAGVPQYTFACGSYRGQSNNHGGWGNYRVSHWLLTDGSLSDAQAQTLHEAMALLQERTGR